MITEPGPDGILAEGENKTIIESIKRKIEISITKHGSKIIALTGHYDCAGNPVDKEKHISHIKKGVEVIKEMGFNAEVIGLWIDENWKVNEID